MILKGTKFQIKVWKYLRTIPKGHVRTYSQVAKAIKKPKAVRAVANAIGKNPYAPKNTLSPGNKIRWFSRWLFR
jgi:O-6-methylguanine DNA methyltransferase